MKELFPAELHKSFSKQGKQEDSKNPTVYAVFQFPLNGWIWFVTEGDAYQDDICFFGYVVGLEREWGYFCLSELESVDFNGIKVFREKDHVPKALSECLKQYGLIEN